MNPLAGIVLVVVSATSFGTLAIFGRYAYADGMDALTILFLRFSLSAVLMAILLAARRESLPRGPALIQLVGMGAIGYVGQAFSYFTALKYASAGLVALLLYLYPLFVAILSAILLRKRITHVKRLALGLALAGTALTVGPEGGQLLGVLLAISAAVIYSMYIIVGTQVMKQVSAVQSSTVIFAAAGAMSGFLMAARGPHLPATGAGWAVIGSIVLIATVLPVVTFLAGLERIGPTNAAMLSTLEPVVTVLLAALLLGETLKPITLLGGGLILVAVVLLTQSELRRPEPMPAGD
ncbi:MAG: DMT family transporter [Anaerolineae bacterium]|jgi:drug/metabolite transporter (DMT)-like permease